MDQALVFSFLFFKCHYHIKVLFINASVHMFSIIYVKLTIIMSVHLYLIEI